MKDVATVNALWDCSGAAKEILRHPWRWFREFRHPWRCCIGASHWCLRALLLLKELFEFAECNINWCAVVEEWCGWVWFLFEFMDEIFDGCFDVVGTGCFGHWKLGW